MTRCARIGATLVAVVGWSVCSVGWGQSGSGESRGAQSRGGAASASAGPGKRSSASRPAASGSASPAPDAPAPVAEAPADGAEQKPGGGGYSWSDRKPKAKRGKRAGSAKKVPLDPNKPLATYPGFTMLPDGRSVVWLYLSRSVTLKSSRRGQSVVIELPEVQVGVQNNMNPLETAHFQTPLSRAHLRRTERGAELVLTLREPVVPKPQLLAGPRGTIVLRVTLPRAQHQYSQGSLSASSPAAPTPSPPPSSSAATTRGPGPSP